MTLSYSLLRGDKYPKCYLGAGGDEQGFRYPNAMNVGDISRLQLQSSDESDCIGETSAILVRKDMHALDVQ